MFIPAAGHCQCLASRPRLHHSPGYDSIATGVMSKYNNRPTGGCWDGVVAESTSSNTQYHSSSGGVSKGSDWEFLQLK